MADKEISSLSRAESVTEELLIPCYVPDAVDPAQNVTVGQIREFVEESILGSILSATGVSF